MKKVLLVLGLLLVSVAMTAQTYKVKMSTINGEKSFVKPKGTFTLTDTTLTLDMHIKYQVPMTMNIKEIDGDKIVVFSPENVTNYYIITDKYITLYAETKNEGVSFTQTFGYEIIK